MCSNIAQATKIDPTMLVINDSSPSSYLGVGAGGDSSTGRSPEQECGHDNSSNGCQQGRNKKKRVNNAAPAQRSKLTRQIGMKKAKKLVKLAERRDSKIEA